MRLILLFFNFYYLSLVWSFHNVLVYQSHNLYRSKNTNIVTVFGGSDDTIIHNDESIYFSDSMNSSVPDNSNTNKNSLSIILGENIKRMRKEYGGGLDQREIGKTCLEKIYDKVQEKTVLNKLRKYNYQMNLLKKLENNQVADLEKIKAIDEYKYLMESSKYISNLESGGLYKNWNDNNL